ncbi:DUF3558 family protein [Lentzea albidocapillata]|uniref:DUF3558 domain-containing protein n=1 Tax=Lentzea albidocapillata TaxID=40571 RepID=A0A1W2FKF2_9PSEU|nr:DUF3558 family protein [Lentzea albidocapillata]SMD22457.1 Protein of unknown function [Lentzea albidocapillata]
MNTQRLVVLVIALGLSGCAMARPPVKTVEPFATPSTTPADTPACRLFDPADLTEHRFYNGYASASSCIWLSDDSGPLSVSLRDRSTPEQYLAKPDGLKTSPITIGGHSGLLAENSRGPGTCGVVLTHASGIAAAEVLTESGGRSCEIAQAVMKVIEPDLP